MPWSAANHQCDGADVTRGSQQRISLLEFVFP